MTTPKKTPATAETPTAPADAVTAVTTTEARPEETPTVTVPAAVVGPTLSVDVDPVTVVLAHHLRIDGTEYKPGDEVLVNPDFARHLRTQGYANRA
ncbi:hypothetical protein ACIP9H_33685 [Streptomyces sp. NPDC088732]|uniref:DUF7210 family protein n=1 Tax=Streptomyces sp. NPDC088732 TaxID=3365879 RepID=UPI0037F82241